MAQENTDAGWAGYRRTWSRTRSRNMTSRAAHHATQPLKGKLTAPQSNGKGTGQGAEQMLHSPGEGSGGPWQKERSETQDGRGKKKETEQEAEAAAAAAETKKERDVTVTSASPSVAGNSMRDDGGSACRE